jgi:protein CpxP
MLKTAGRRTAITASALLVLAAAVGTATLAAQPRGPMRGRAFAQERAPRAAGLARFGLALRALDLTEQQREQVRAVLEQHRAENRAIAEKSRAARERMRAAAAATLDEAALRAAASSLVDAQVEAAVLRAKVRSEVLALLTEEQRQKAEEMRAKGEERQRARAERMKARQQRPRVP